MKNEGNWKTKLKLCGSNDKMLNLKHGIDISNHFDLNLSKEIKSSKQAKNLLKESTNQIQNMTVEVREKRDNNSFKNNKMHKRINYKTFMEHLDKTSKDYSWALNYNQFRSRFSSIIVWSIHVTYLIIMIWKF